MWKLEEIQKGAKCGSDSKIKRLRKDIAKKFGR